MLQQAVKSARLIAAGRVDEERCDSLLLGFLK